MTDIQSIVFLIDYGWTNSKAKKWLDLHHFYPIKEVDKHITGQLRYRMKDPALFSAFATKKLSDGINFVFGVY